MPRTRPPYPPEFRREAIKLVRISSKSQHQIAEDLGISDVTLRNWVKQAERDEGTRPDGLSSDEREELARLRRENQTLQTCSSATFVPTDPNQTWAADITYISTWEGFLYVAHVQDLFSRLIVGWSMADHLRAELVVDALEMAIYRRRPDPGLVHHSDPGCQPSTPRCCSPNAARRPASRSRWVASVIAMTTPSAKRSTRA